MAIAGVGTVFRRYDSSAEAWEEIAEINNITGPGMTRETIDTSALDTEGGYRTFITGFRDAGTVSMSMNFTREVYELLKDDFESDTPVGYEIILPDADNTSFEFEGLVTEIPLTIPPDDKVTVDLTIKISGEVTMNSGSKSGPIE